VNADTDPTERIEFHEVKLSKAWILVVLPTTFPRNAESRCVIEGTQPNIVNTEVLVSRNDAQPVRKTNRELKLPPC